MHALAGKHYVGVYLSIVTGVTWFDDVLKMLTPGSSSGKSSITWAILHQDVCLLGGALTM